MSPEAARPIGMFDSGLGGLTVARAVMDLLPYEDLVYFGDTARCPYGPKPVEEVRSYALEIADLLVNDGVKLLVVACNSAESAAFYESTGRYDIPIVTVIEPGVRAALAATRNRRIGVIGTEATISSRAYDKTVASTRANVALITKACPLFVDYVEKGDTTSDELLDIARGYLEPLKQEGIDTLILGCTHYPLLSGVIQYVMGDDVVLISSAEATANEVFKQLRALDLMLEGPREATHRFISSGETDSFGELLARFLGSEFDRVEEHRWAEEPDRRAS